jgi:hypothetical protein
MYPVEVAYLQEPAPDYVRKAAEVVWNINLQVITHLLLDDIGLMQNESSKVLEMSWYS